jgi:hypothetical protein
MALEKADYQGAMDVQDACNLSGVLHSWSKLVTRIWEEARTLGHGTDWVNRHPINVLYASKVSSLTGAELISDMSAFSKAYDACKEAVSDLPHWFKRLKINCEDYFEEVEAFARESGQLESFHGQLAHLTHGHQSDEELALFGSRIAEFRTVLFHDFAPHSFAFEMQYKKEEDEEWKHFMNGGLIYHGPHDGYGSGGSPTFSVTVDKAEGWRVHT